MEVSEDTLKLGKGAGARKGKGCRGNSLWLRAWASLSELSRGSSVPEDLMPFSSLQEHYRRVVHRQTCTPCTYFFFFQEKRRTKGSISIRVTRKSTAQIAAAVWETPASFRRQRKGVGKRGSGARENNTAEEKGWNTFHACMKTSQWNLVCIINIS